MRNNRLVKRLIRRHVVLGYLFPYHAFARFSSYDYSTVFAAVEEASLMGQIKLSLKVGAIVAP